MLCLLSLIAAIMLTILMPGHTEGQASEKTILLQKFRVKPKDVTVEEGSDVTLQCEVDHRAGRVQWTKDGYALGYTHPLVPGFPRYLKEVDESKGIFHLKLRNVTLDDVGNFECQVGPYVNMTVRSEPIRAEATVEVTSPPISVDIVDHVNGERIDVKNQQMVTLNCTAKGSRPCANIIWKKGDVTLSADTWVNEKINTTDKKCNVYSVVNIPVTLNDDSVYYSCQASSNTSKFMKPLSATVQFNVLYPPEKPYIDGYSDGSALHAGEKAEFVCRARGGNPLPQLLWYKNGNLVQSVYETFKDEISESKYVFQVNGSDNEANYTCEANSRAMVKSVTKSIKLKVYFGPEKVLISGNDEEKSEVNITLSCSTSLSNPASIIKWTVDGVSMDNNEMSAKESAGVYGGFVTKSDIRFVIPANKREVSVVCHAFNPQISGSVTAKKNIRVLYPPGKPVITGYVRGGFMVAGSFHNLTCTSSGGNPLANLTWYRNGEKINSITKTDDMSATAVIVVLVNASDNGAQYKCEAVNSATSVSLKTTVILQVYFSPSNMTVTVTPNKLKVGTAAKLYCNSSSSNPPAEVSWWRDGIPVTDGISTFTYPGEYSGSCSQSVLSTAVTFDMNGNMFTCQAKNTILMSTVHYGVRLSVLHKPAFVSLSQTYFEVTAGGKFSILLEVASNPPVQNFNWLKDESAITKYTSGPSLNIVNARKSDAGFYSCVAINSEGSDVISFNLTVRHSLTIIQAPEFVMVEEGSDAQLNCSASGYPLEAAHIRWHKNNSETWTARANYDFVNGTSYLQLKSVSKNDVGYFYCIADNGIPPSVNKSVHLIIEYAPIITTHPRKFPTEVNSTVWFACGASGAPQVEFRWIKNDLIIRNSSKYSVTIQRVDYQNYTSVLLINNVTSDDYGFYNCVATNKHGQANLTNQLTVVSQPDPPSQLMAEVTSSHSIRLSWTLKFDGGYPTSFQIRYYNSHHGNKYYKYEDVGQNSTYTVTGLESGLQYIFDVVAFNKLGRSDFSDSINITVPGAIKSPIAALVDGEGLILIIAAVIGIILILLNIFLILIFVLRRSRKNEKDTVSENSSSKSRSVELFGSSSFNGTVSRGTLSSQSEKSITSYDEMANSRGYKYKETNYPSNGYVIDPLHSYVQRDNENFIVPQARYGSDNMPPYEYNSLDRSTHDNHHRHQNGYTSLNRTQQRIRYNEVADIWPPPITALPLEKWEPVYSVTTDSKDSSPILPPPMTTFNYTNVQERYLIV